VKESAKINNNTITGKEKDPAPYTNSAVFVGR